MPVDAGIIQDSFIIKNAGALGPLREIEQAANRLSGVLDSLKTGFVGLLGAAGIGGLATSAAGLLKVNNAMEQTTTVLAGMLQANKFTKTFQEGMELSADAMAQIRQEAERLPGTDVDFLEAFKVTFQAMKDVGMTDLPKMITFSDNMVAVAKAYGVDIAQASRDINLMLSGHAGEDVKTFRHLKGQLGVRTTEEFNKLSAADRVKRMSGLLEKNKGMLKAFENTWDAISSTTESIAKNVSLAFGGPLFDVAKQGLKALNDLLGKYSDQIKTVANVMGEGIADGLRGAAGYLRGRLPHSDGQLKPAYGSGLLGANYNALPSLAGGAIGALGGPVGGLLAGGLLKALNQPSFLESFRGIFLPIDKVLRGFAGVWESATDRIRDGFMMFGSFLGTTIMPILQAVGSVMGDIFGAIKNVLDDKANSFKEIFYYLGVIGQGFAQVLAPAIKLLGHQLAWLHEKILKHFIDTLATALQHMAATVRLFETIGKTGGLARIGLLTGGGIGTAYRNALTDVQRESQTRLRYTSGSDTTLGKIVGAFDSAVDAEKARQEADRRKKAAENGPKAKPPAPQVHFHNAKFSIEQRFAEGFDPDRVATAFRRDIGHEAVQRVGIPLFSPI